MTTKKPVCQTCKSQDEQRMPRSESYVVWNIEQQDYVIDPDEGLTDRWFCPICVNDCQIEWVDA